MSRFLVLAALFVAGAQAGIPLTSRLLPNVDPNGNRIVGGEETTIENVPYIVAVLYNGVHSCGGSIIAPDVILTAAHCIDFVVASQVSIRAGSTTKSSGGEVISVDKFIKHENYINGPYNDDIAILFLSSPITLSAASRLISMPAQGVNVADGVMARTSGWGTTEFGTSNNPEFLRTVLVPIVNQDVCRQAYGSMLSDDMLCAGYVGVGGKDACQNDSGGPLEANGVLVGVVSWGIGCALPNYPTVYARVSYYRNWIDGKTN